MNHDSIHNIWGSTQHYYKRVTYFNKFGHLVAVVGQGRRHLLDRALHQHAADHAKALAVGVHIVQRLDYQPEEVSRHL